MEEEIKAFLDQYIEANPDKKISDSLMKSLKDNMKSFQSLVEKLKYKMKLEVTGEGALVVQFYSEQGQVYTTYTFNNAVA